MLSYGFVFIQDKDLVFVYNSLRHFRREGAGTTWNCESLQLMAVIEGRAPQTGLDVVLSMGSILNIALILI
jgi:hypothetical protein